MIENRREQMQDLSKSYEVAHDSIANDFIAVFGTPEQGHHVSELTSFDKEKILPLVVSVVEKINTDLGKYLADTFLLRMDAGKGGIIDISNISDFFYESFHGPTTCNKLKKKYDVGEYGNRDARQEEFQYLLIGIERFLERLPERIEKLYLESISTDVESTGLRDKILHKLINPSSKYAIPTVLEKEVEELLDKYVLLETISSISRQYEVYLRNELGKVEKAEEKSGYYDTFHARYFAENRGIAFVDLDYLRGFFTAKGFLELEKKSTSFSAYSNDTQSEGVTYYSLVYEDSKEVMRLYFSKTEDRLVIFVLLDDSEEFIEALEGEGYGHLLDVFEDDKDI